ncbi:MAG: GNAT family N-acetyltransferase [Anaerolineae bacterium]|nr:GNAT family N-acetyltransferase [Anaerolineae bacterium]
MPRRKPMNDVPAVELVPVRLWQAVPFLRLNMEIVRGIDPLADRFLARPWAPSSLLEYGYMLARFLRSYPYFIFVSGQQAGLLWLVRWEDLYFVNTLGLFPQYQQRGIGMRTVSLIEEQAARLGCTYLATAVAPGNEAVHRLIVAYGGRPLGLATVRAQLVGTELPVPALPGVTVEKVDKRTALQAWRRWRLHEVEQVAGPDGLKPASTLLKQMYLPKGEHLLLRLDGQEMGYACICRGQSEVETALFPAVSFWEGEKTVGLLAALEAWGGCSVRRLELTRTHYYTLTNAGLKLERYRVEEERHFAFKRVTKPEPRGAAHGA